MCVSVNSRLVRADKWFFPAIKPESPTAPVLGRFSLECSAVLKKK
jgi:hypothetical protein